MFPHPKLRRSLSGSGYGAFYHGSIRWFLVGRGIPGMTQQRGWSEGRTWEDLIVIVFLFFFEFLFKNWSLKYLHYSFFLVGEIHDFISWLEMKMLKNKSTSSIDRSMTHHLRNCCPGLVGAFDFRWFGTISGEIWVVVRWGLIWLMGWSASLIKMWHVLLKISWFGQIQCFGVVFFQGKQWYIGIGAFVEMINDFLKFHEAPDVWDARFPGQVTCDHRRCSAFRSLMGWGFSDVTVWVVQLRCLLQNFNALDIPRTCLLYIVKTSAKRKLYFGWHVYIESLCVMCSFNVSLP